MIIIGLSRFTVSISYSFKSYYGVEYAQTRFDELQQSGNYRNHGETVEINGFKADRGVFVDLTKNLGHNRIDVLKSYLRTK